MIIFFVIRTTKAAAAKVARRETFWARPKSIVVRLTTGKTVVSETKQRKTFIQPIRNLPVTMPANKELFYSIGILNEAIDQGKK